MLKIGDKVRFTGTENPFVLSRIKREVTGKTLTIYQRYESGSNWFKVIMNKGLHCEHIPDWWFHENELKLINEDIPT